MASTDNEQRSKEKAVGYRRGVETMGLKNKDEISFDINDTSRPYRKTREEQQAGLGQGEADKKFDDYYNAHYKSAPGVNGRSTPPEHSPEEPKPEEERGVSGSSTDNFPGGPLESPATPQRPPERTEPASSESEEIQRGNDMEEQEIEYANQLALEQDISAEAGREAKNILEEGRSYRSPSLFKYYIFFVIAGVNDAVDLLELTGFGAIIAWLVSFFLSALLIFLFWFTDSKYKNAKKYTKNLEQRVLAISKNIAQLESRALKGARILGKIPGMAKTSTKLTKTIGNISQKIKGNPTGKAIVGGAAELFPFFSILPWSMISVLWSYIDERRIYKTARKSAEETYNELSQNANEIV